jgi:hypothetical protein
LGVVTLSEVPFIFFLLLALDFTFRFLRSLAARDMLLTIFFLSLANLLRFEGWCFTLLILFVFIRARVGFRMILGFVAAVSVPIMYILVASYRMTGDAFWGINESDRFVLTSLKGSSPLNSLRDVPDAFVAFWIVFFPIGVWYTARDRSVQRYLFIFSIPLLYTFYKVLTLSLTGQYRYFMTGSILSLPFVAAGIDQMAAIFFRRYPGPRTIAFAIGAVLLCAGKYNKVMIEPLQPGRGGKFDKGFISSALWMKDSLQGARVIVDDDQFSNYSWKVYADKIVKNNRTNERSYAVEVSYDSWKDSTFLANTFYNVIRQDSVTHLAFFKGGIMATRLNFYRPIETRKNLRFKKVYENNGYRIYEVF